MVSVSPQFTLANTVLLYKKKEQNHMSQSSRLLPTRNLCLLSHFVLNPLNNFNLTVLSCSGGVVLGFNALLLRHSKVNTAE